MQAIEAAWVPTQTATFIITSIISLVRAPHADNALEIDIAAKYQSNYNQWQATAAEWTMLYATNK